MNGATIEASKETIEAISKCGFVDGVYLTRNDDEATSISARSINKRIVEEAQEGPGDDYVLQTTNEQLQLYNLLPLHRAGYKGKGIRIGVADGGFYRADSLDWLPREQWLGYADLTDDADGIFGRTGNHGSLCLGTIVARRSDYEGAATEASYYLFKTEEAATESIKEIDNWVAAIEMADSLGLHIVSTSLGYTTFDDEATNWSYADMDGKTSRGAQAAVIAARKGMLLVVAMGNDGAKAWHYLSTPADADSILSVGAVNREGTIAKFSSYGPSADGRVKPEVCALGEGTTLLDVNNGNVFPGNGTSFACPLIAGMAACLWSALPEASNMAIREMIIRSADRYTQPQEQYGYGIPDAWKAYTEAMTGVNAPSICKGYQKWINENGQMYILYNGNIYNVLGYRL
jgi:subtilisin family serine protease